MRAPLRSWRDIDEQLSYIEDDLRSYDMEPEADMLVSVRCRVCIVQPTFTEREALRQIGMLIESDTPVEEMVEHIRDIIISSA